MNKTNKAPRQGMTYQGKTGCGPMYITINEKEVFIKLGKPGGCAGAHMLALGTVLGTALHAGVQMEVLKDALKGNKCHSEPCCINVAAQLMEDHLKSLKEVTPT